MEKSRERNKKRLSERMVRNDDIFCSLLFDSGNRTLRVVDFRGGNFQAKHAYLERVLMSENMRKIFTLIERDDMAGWQRVGYHREGAIPGYYKRSDAYIMSRVYDADFEPEHHKTDDSSDWLNEVKNAAKSLSEQKAPGIKLHMASESEAIEFIRAELERQGTKAKTTKKAKGKGVGEDDDSGDDLPPAFSQFSREVEFFHFIVQNKRTKQANVIGAEYQDCFGNAKVDLFFMPTTKADQNLVRSGLNDAVDELGKMGAVSVFGFAPENAIMLNAIYLSCGFRNTGLLRRQLLTESGALDLVLWTRKLV